MADPVTLDLSQAQPIQQAPVQLDMSKAEPLGGKPGLVARASEQLGLTQHPIDQLIGELKQLKEHPVSTLWETAKAPIIGLRDLAYKLTTDPVNTVQDVTGGKRFAEDVQNKNYAGAAGTLIGGGIQAALPAAKDVNLQVPGRVQGVAREMYQSALKPSTALGEAKIGRAVTAGLENEIPVSKGGLLKLGDLVDDYNAKIKATIDASPNRPIDTAKVAARADEAKARFANQVNPTADLEAIDAAKQEFITNNPGTIRAADAQAMKTGTYQQLKGKAYGELKSASIEAQKSLARGLKEEIANQFPELKGLNAAEGGLLGLDPLLEKAVQRIGNHQIIGIGTPIAAGAVKAVTGSSGLAGAAAVMKAVIDQPIIKSRLAIALWKGSKGGLTLQGAQARIAGYSSALEKASSAEASGDQTNSQ